MLVGPLSMSRLRNCFLSFFRLFFFCLSFFFCDSSFHSRSPSPSLIAHLLCLFALHLIGCFFLPSISFSLTTDFPFGPITFGPPFYTHTQFKSTHFFSSHRISTIICESLSSVCLFVCISV